MKIALLLPRSILYGTLGKDIVNALNLVFKQSNESFELVIEDISHGANENLILEKAQKIVLQVQPDATIALVNYQASQALANAFVENRELLMIMNLGANFPLELEIGPSVFYHSLNLWESAWAMGKYMAEQGKTNTLFSSAFYDCGYHLNHFAAEGIESKAGKVELFDITQAEKGQLLLSPFDEKMSSVRPDSVFAVYNNKEAVQFLKHWNKHYAEKDVELFTLGTTVAAPFLKEAIEEARSLTSVMAWSAGLETPMNQAFVAGYDDRYEMPPSVFSALAYEVGLVLVDLLKQGAFEGKRNLLFEKVKSIELGGLFRKVVYNDHDHHIPTQHHLSVLDAEGTIVKSEPLTLTQEIGNAKKVLENQPLSGWRHPYLCL